MKDRVSVIIPVYNAEKTLERCVESVALGEYRDVEIILVEDRSKDRSWEICLELSKRFENVRCYQNETNCGVSHTRNHGMQYARGEYVLFVDSDDWVSGKYVKEMLEAADRYPDTLVICGLHFIDRVAGFRRKYLWNDGEKSVARVERTQFFSLAEQFLLQQLWNKIFRRELIEADGITFDESQTMGEDFQFVLAYLEAAQVKSCTVVNQPLYYYIRANNNSLMSRFGLTESDHEFARMERLRNICGPTDETIDRQYAKALQDKRTNYVYWICKNPTLNRNQKLDYIEQIVKDGNGERYYREQCRRIRREALAEKAKQCCSIPARIRNREKLRKRDKLARIACRQLTAKDFTIIAQNCIGGVFYHDAGLKFLSPTINLFFKEPDFVRFVGNLPHYLSLEIEMRWDEEYPVGQLEDVSVCFMHYHTCREAKEKWEERKQRIRWDKILVIATDREGFGTETWDAWCRIPYPKVLFASRDYASPEVVYYPEYTKEGQVPDLIPDREFYRNGVLVKTANTLADA